MTTIFEKIVTRELPASIVYEDDQLLSFLSIAPLNPGHTLIITKQPYQWLYEVPDDLYQKLMAKVKEMMIAIKTAYDCDFAQVVVMGTDVPHVHVHIIPRWKDDGKQEWHLGTYASDEEREKEVEKIRKNL